MERQAEQILLNLNRDVPSMSEKPDGASMRFIAHHDVPMPVDYQSAIGLVAIKKEPQNLPHLA